MKKYLMFLLILCFIGTYADVFLSYDEDGNVIYSDRESEDSKKIDLPDNNFFITDFVTSEEPLILYRGPKKPEPELEQKITITAPKDQDAISDGRGNIKVTLKLEKKLDVDDQIEIWDMAGRKAKLLLTTKKTTFELINLDRGEHHLVAKVVNNKNIVAISDLVIVHVRRQYVKPLVTPPDQFPILDRVID